jgi:hypothetical protein
LFLSWQLCVVQNKSAATQGPFSCIAITHQHETLELGIVAGDVHVWILIPMRCSAGVFQVSSQLIASVRCGEDLCDLSVPLIAA